MGTTDPIIGYSQKITDLTKERDTIITVLKEFLAQPLSVADLDDDM